MPSPEAIPAFPEDAHKKARKRGGCGLNPNKIGEEGKLQLDPQSLNDA
jgi:hypothetical protein